MVHSQAWRNPDKVELQCSVRQLEGLRGQTSASQEVIFFSLQGVEQATHVKVMS